MDFEWWRAAVALGAALSASAVAGAAGAPEAPALGDPPMPWAAESPASVSRQEGIEGAWRARTYVLASGPEHPVDGLIFFTATDWTVLFFVLDGEEQPRRGSGEGGTYTLDGNRLTFRHRYNLSGGEALAGLPASDWSMQVRGAADQPVEPCTIELAGDRLTIHFPSGNRMVFARSS